MNSATPQPNALRLVGLSDETALSSWHRRERARTAVAQENRRAATNPSLEPTDPRWVLATRAYAQLQGSTLTPERRARVMRTARHLGIRPFDANLIIAVMQDHARRAEPPAAAADTLKLIQAPVPASSLMPVGWGRWLAALLSALVLASLLIRWLTTA